MSDTRRIADAKKRASEALEDAAYYERRATESRAKAALLARTWGFKVEDCDASHTKSP